MGGRGAVVQFLAALDEVKSCVRVGSNAIRFEREVIDINVGLLVRIIFLSKLFYPTGQVHRHQEDSSSQHSAGFSTKQPQELTLLNKPVFFLLL